MAVSLKRVAPMRHVPRSDRWFAATATALRRASFDARVWLGWPDSLTERLAQHIGDRVQVRVLSERRDRLLSGEREHLNVVSRTARVREVQLEVGGAPYVVARTVFPETTARVMHYALRGLGTRSLGSLLFGALRAPVQTREFARLDPASSLWRILSRHLPDNAQHLWARRALHRLQGQPLVVTEIFLPRLLSARERTTLPET
jgi:chorismate--pyruvate lyase